MENANERQVEILQEVAAERERQDRFWGGASHDDLHDERDWTVFILGYLAKATDWRDRDPEKFRRNMVKVAALAVASIEAYDRILEAATSRDLV